MISVDISNVWGELSLPDLLAIEKEIYDAHAQLADGTDAGSQFPDWLNLPARECTEEHSRILKAAQKIRSDSDICIVVGTTSDILGSQAAIVLLQGPNHNLGRGRGDPQIFFAGNTLSTRHWNELMRLLEGKDFSVIVISRSGTTLEPAIAFRGLRWLLERKYGTDAAAKRIYAVTDPVCGALSQMALEEKWEAFVLPVGADGEFSVLSPAGLLPMAVAGVDILDVLRGAMEAKEEYDLRSFENPVWLYAGVRNALYRKGTAIEILEAFEPGFGCFGRWWQQLFGRSEGRDGTGIFPAAADPGSAGQPVREGRRNLFETMVRFDAPEKEYVIGSGWKNLDGLGNLEGKSLDCVERMVFEDLVSANEEGGIPVITMDCGELNDRKAGELFYFMELACGISAYVLGAAPLDRSGMETDKSGAGTEE